MTEAWGQDGAAAFAAQPAADEALTAGALLRRARETAGLHVAALAVSLKVPVRKLEALEEDRWDLLPDAVFARALASSVCRTLKIDPQPVLDRLPRTSAPRLIPSDEGINTPFRAPNDGAAQAWRGQLTRPTFLVVFALLIGALVLVLLPSMQRDDTAPGIAAPTASPQQPVAVAAATAEPAASSAPVANVVQSAAVGTATAVLPAGGASDGAAALKPAKTLAAASAAKPASAAAAPSAPASVATSEAAAAASGIVVFRTRKESWVEVTDAKGAIAFRRLLAPGEATGVSGTLPLQVTVGRVDATEVQVRGKPFDLQPVSRDNVARFEVK